MDARPGGVGPLVSAGQVVPTAPLLSSVPDDALDAVQGQLARLPELDVADHVEVFAAIHRQLTDALAVTGAGQASGTQHSPAAPQPGRPQPVPRGR